MKPLEIAIDGMHCNGCVQRVTDALKKTAGVTTETVELGKARVQIDEARVTAATVLAALDKLGFDARVSKGG